MGGLWAMGLGEGKSAQEFLQDDHKDYAERDGNTDLVGSRFLAGFGHNLGKDHPDHGTGGEAEANGEDRAKEFDEQVGGNGHDRLGNAGKDGKTGGGDDPHAAGDEDQTNGQALGDIMECDGSGDKDAQALIAAEGNADPDPFGERVECHDPDDEDGFTGIGSLEIGDGHILVAVEPLVADDDKNEADEDTEDRFAQPVVEAFKDERKTGGEHEAGGDGVTVAQPLAGNLFKEKERHGSEAGGDGGQGSIEENGEDIFGHGRRVVWGVGETSRRLGSRDEVSGETDLVSGEQLCGGAEVGGVGACKFGGGVEFTDAGVGEVGLKAEDDKSGGGPGGEALFFGLEGLVDEGTGGGRGEALLVGGLEAGDGIIEVEADLLFELAEGGLGTVTLEEGGGFAGLAGMIKEREAKDGANAVAGLLAVEGFGEAGTEGVGILRAGGNGGDQIHAWAGVIGELAQPDSAGL